MNEDQEPSVLDFVKSILIPGRKLIRIPPPVAVEQPPTTEPLLSDVRSARAGPDTKPLATSPARAGLQPFPWLVLLALLTGLLAQLSLEPRADRSWVTGAFLYAIAGAGLTLAMLRGQFHLAEPVSPALPDGNGSTNWTALLVSLALGLAAFLLFGSERFTTVNTAFWLASLAAFIYAIKPKSASFIKWTQGAWQRLKSGASIKVTPWVVLCTAVFILGVVFRIYQFDQVPSQMVSDHAEKLYDIQDVLNGNLFTFFIRNTGREAFQFYWTAFLIKLLNTGITFFSLKLGTILLGILTLPFLYLLGKELGSPRVGLFTMLFAGIAYWPNLISRIALRFTLYPFFFAPTFYYFLRGMRTGQRRYFVLSGIFMGIGLHGYSPFRVVPALIILAVALYLLHHRSNRAVKHAMVGLVLIGAVAIIVALPLLRYAVDYPDVVMYRALTRVTSAEQAITGSPVLIFLQNLWRAMTMFAWDNGEVWVLSIPHRPILDVVSGALYHLGFLAVLINYFRKQRWTDLLLLISIPFLMLPSIFSLAFPAENPSLNRTAGAIIPVFLLIGFALDGIFCAIKRAMGASGRTLAGGLVAALLFLSASQNYDLVFNQYRSNFDNSSWPSAQIGAVVRDFIDTWGNRDSAYLVGYPHWVDSRLVGINAGTPDKDYAIFTDQFELTLAQPAPKLFILNVNDTPDLEALNRLYPEGVLRLIPSELPGREFYIYFVLR
ncbi:MAG: ArnT family glycosyltransferase [Bellilinea sp.]